MSDQVQLPSLDDLQSDCGHLAELVGVITDQIQEMGVGEVITQPLLHRHAALLWIARDLAEALRDNIERVDNEQRGGVVETRRMSARRF